MYSTKLGLIYSRIGYTEMLEVQVNYPIAVRSTLIGSIVNGVSTGITQFIPTGISDKAISSVKIYPNPVNNILTIKLGSEKVKELKIYNSTGTLML